MNLPKPIEVVEHVIWLLENGQATEARTYLKKIKEDAASLDTKLPPTFVTVSADTYYEPDTDSDVTMFFIEGRSDDLLDERALIDFLTAAAAGAKSRYAIDRAKQAWLSKEMVEDGN